jgi:hypothetical protein
MQNALLLSFAAHAAILLAAGVLGLVHPPALAEAAPELAPAADRWTGTTADLPFEGTPGALYDVSLDPASPPPAPAPEQAPASVPVPVPAPAPSPEPHAALQAAPPVPVPPVLPAPPRPKRRPRTGAPVAAHAAGTSPASSPAEGPRGGGSGGVTGSFGSEGSASPRDMGYALTRAIPVACVQDPIWNTISPGDAGRIEIAIHVDATGHIASTEPRSHDPPKALLSIVRRTVPLLEAGTFAVRDGAVGEGTEIFELHAEVSNASASEQYGFEYAHGRGKAPFTQASGKHVEVTVKRIRTEMR